MEIPPLSDAKILDSWGKNVSPWTTAVRQQQIASRKLVTDQAIVETILDYAPQTVLDLGCGEGWLARQLAAMGIQVIGVDAIPELVAAAQQAGDGEFHVATYEAIAAGAFRAAVDLMVCNFSLLGKESVEGVFAAKHLFLNPGGHFVVQTIHPVIGCGESPYQDGWREGSWTGFSDDFTDPAPWYFRTLESWVRLFNKNGFRLVELREPLHPRTEKPASIIFVGLSAA
jgi:2-polyprenyl-3-methyl-5-hydroxy-6-metoxy-1,4-benzoquinol methylase